MLAEGAMAALSLSGTMLGYYPVRVLPSKTAIAPVNPTFLPRVSSIWDFFLFVIGTHRHTYIYLELIIMCDSFIPMLIYILLCVAWISLVLINSVRWWTWDVLKNYLLYQYWQEGSFQLWIRFRLFQSRTGAAVLLSCSLDAGYSSRCQNVFRITLWRGSYIYLWLFLLVL